MKKNLKLQLLIVLINCFLFTTAWSQYKVVRTESFDALQFFPLGWTGGKVIGSDVNNYTERVTIGTAPVCVTHTGAAMLRYRSGFMFNAGEQTFVASPKYDLTNNPGTATVSFWMYRDNTAPTFNDSVTLYINNAPTVGSGKIKVIGPISRVSGAAGAWAQFSAVIPPGFNNTSAYFVFVFTNRQTAAQANIYIDDFSVETYPKSSVLVSSQLFYQETGDIVKGTSDNLIIGIKVSVDGAGDSLRVDSIVTNGNGSTQLLPVGTDITALSGKLWFTKGTNTPIFSAANQFGTGLSPGFYRDKFTKTNFFLENGDNYFWLSYSIPASATSLHYVDADFNGIYYRRASYAGADTSRAPIVSALTGARQIDGALCNGVIPTLTIGTSWLNGSYTNNDYINRVYLRGANAVTPAYPYIDNNINDIGPPIAPFFSGPAPFTVQLPSYQQMPSAATSPFHPNISAVLVQGTTYSTAIAGPAGQGLALQCGTWSSSNYMAAWIDFNKDGDVLDAGEKIVQSGPMNALSWTYSAVSVPATLTAPTPNVVGPAGISFGNVTLRVREVFATPNIDACQSGYIFGETEDYKVTIIPSCPAGVKVWLGYTDDWNTPSNWCGGVPTSNDIALIDEVGYLGGNQTGAPFDPVIHSGTTAVAKSIRLSGTDTLKIDAPTSASLQIMDSLTISYNTPPGGGGKMIVNSAFSDSAQLSNGNLTFTLTPFKGTRRQQRSQFIYTKNDLLLKGMIAGDVVDQLVFYFRSTPGVAVGFGNLSIKYATVDSLWSEPKFASPPTALAPATSAYVTIFSNAAFTIPTLPVTGGPLTINLIPGSFIWNGVSDIVLEICYDRGPIAAAASDHLLTQSQKTGSNQFLSMNSTSTTPSGCSMTFPVTLPGIAIASSFRPNITFMFHRPYTKFPINITGNGATTAGRWVNNGTFTAGSSVVTFSNASLNQEIGGANNTTFSDLVINKTGALATQRVQMQADVTIDSSVALTAGYLDLNQKTLTLNNPLPAAATRTSGWILSESGIPPYGIVSWNMASNSSLHTFPFGTTTGNYIPLEFTNTIATNIGTLSAATSKALPDNTPYPAAGGPFNINVTHMNSAANGLDISISDVVDRFWMLNKSLAGSINAVLKFSYLPGIPASGEEPSGGPYTYTAQRFANTGPSRVWLNKGGINGLGNVNVTLISDTINGPWTLTNILNPMGDSILPCPSIAPPTSVTPSGATSVCIGSAINLNATSAGNSIDWFTSSMGGTSIGSSSSGIDFPVIPAANTIFFAEARDNNGCISTARTPTGLVTIDSFPGTSISPSGPTTFCSGSSVNLTANGTATLVWNTGDTSTTINVSISGTYIAVRTTISGCVDSAQVVVTVNPLPMVTVSGTSSICKKSGTLLTASGASTYTWAPATGLSATSGSVVTAQPLATTTYSITGTSSFGCVKTVTKKITIKNLPTITISPTTATICPGDSKIINAGGSAVSYTWSPTSGLNVTTGSTVIATPATTTTYTVTATNSNSCTGTKTSKITILCKISTDLSVTNITGTTADLSWTGQSCATGYKLQYRVLGTTSWTTININTNTQSLTLTGLLLSTSYEWKVATKCSTNIFAAFSAKSSFTTAGAKFSNEPVHSPVESLSVYPNPAMENIHVELFCEKDGNGFLQLFNNIGQLMYSRNIVIADGMYTDQINMADYVPGLYLVRIETGDIIKTSKFLKE